MLRIRWRSALAGLALAAIPGISATAEDLRVVASIKPVHSLVAAVMQGAGEPTLLVKGAASPHTYALRPSDAEALEQADVVFWVGEAFERFLAKPLETLSAKARVVELAETEGLVLLAPRRGEAWEAKGEEEAHGHGHEAYDVHVWLDPRNADLMVARIAEELAARDPAAAATYRRNAEAVRAELAALDAELAAELAPIRHVPFVVSHDAYQYFERRYGLANAGAITVGPEQPPGARHLEEIRRRIQDGEVRCVFSEPNLDPALVVTVVEGTAARTGVLDPEGASLAERPELYLELMRALAASLAACLAPDG